MQATAKTTLASLVEEHVSTLVRESICIGRHAKRARYHYTPGESSEDDAKPSFNTTTPTTSSGSPVVLRRRLHVDDINCALEWRGSSRIYGNSLVVPQDDNKDDKEGTGSRAVDLNRYLQSTFRPKAPSEIGMTLHWLAVDGNVPRIPQNPSTSAQPTASNTSSWPVLSLSSSTTPHPAGGNSTQEGIQVNQLLPRLLSEELQLYFTRIIMAMEIMSSQNPTPQQLQQQDMALMRVARDSGLQELVPFWIQYIVQQLSASRTCVQKRVLIRLSRSLLYNPRVHLELHVHQLLPCLLTCMVARHLSHNNDDERDLHSWSLRSEASHTLYYVCHLFGDKYKSLKATVLKTLCRALDPMAQGRCTTLYGGFMGMACMGPKAVDSFVIPMACAFWKGWEQQQEQQGEVSQHTPRLYAIQQCQLALLQCLGIWYQWEEGEGTVNATTTSLSSVSPATSMELEETFGETLIPLRVSMEQEYAVSFL